MSRRIAATPVSLAGFLTIAIVVLLAAFGPLIAPYDPSQFHPASRLQGPSAAFWLGTDQFGRDILSRVLAGAPASILFGVFATALGTVLGTAIGLASGYYGGRFDEIVMRILDAVIAVPNLLLVLLLVTVLGSSTTNAIIAVGIAFAPNIARVVRSSTLSIRSQDYVSAARARGEGDAHIMLGEILPNVLPAIVIESSLRVAVAVLVGATLSYLGLGAQPPASDWGLMIAEARPNMFANPWLVLSPGLFIAFSSIAFNLFGDGLRDAFNPRLASS
jgi:peptide/nickel transport system permease protein